MNNAEGTIDDRYLTWLYSQVGAVRNRNPSRSFWQLAKQLYRTPFYWFVPNDDNRVEDGRDLRLEFLGEEELDEKTHAWLELDCSMFEMLLALAKRAAYESSLNYVEWFWIFIRNLGIRHHYDATYEISIKEEIDEILTNLNQRDYAWDGTGGLFPLKNPNRDQREVEIWYQMQMYLHENEDI